MQEYIDNGRTVGLAARLKRGVSTCIVRQHPVEILENPETLRGDPVLPGSFWDLREIW